jgi:HPt (histidine-containing phosphotransfer) domain-containing protein
MYLDKASIELTLRELNQIGDPDLVSNLISLYFQNIEEQKRLLISSFNDNDFNIISKLCHSLKSTFGNFGSKILFKKLVNLESLTSKHFELSKRNEVQILLSEVLIEIDQFSDFLRHTNCVKK